MRRLGSSYFASVLAEIGDAARFIPRLGGNPSAGSPTNTFHVIAGHSRSKNGVASLAYVPAIHVLFQ
jgi:hypothetical protein